jgi:protein tyrosine/serine phosphatase
MSRHELRVAGLLNARDVAGASSAPVLRPGVLFRAACPHELSAPAALDLRDRWGIVRVVDLRSGAERSLVPCPAVAAVAGLEGSHRSLTPDEFDACGTLPWEVRPRPLREGRRAGAAYHRFLQDRPDSVVGALRDVAGAAGGVLVHCSAGKDRTGVVVALALTAVGVDEEETVRDFMASNDSIVELLAQQRRTAYGDRDLDRTPESYAVRAEALRGLFAAVRRERGSVMGWLRAAGWTAADQRRLAGRLVGSEGGGAR